MFNYKITLYFHFTFL